jgi:hypothetical protein
LWVIALWGCVDERIEYELRWPGVDAGRPAPEEPDLVVSHSRIDFGEVRLGEEETVEVTLENNGDGTLTLGGVTLDDRDAPFSITSVGTVLLPPWYTTSFEVTFAPAFGTPALREWRTQIFIDSNDPDTPRTEVKMLGQSAPPADPPR